FVRGVRQPAYVRGDAWHLRRGVRWRPNHLGGARVTGTHGTDARDRSATELVDDQRPVSAPAMRPLAARRLENKRRGAAAIGGLREEIVLGRGWVRPGGKKDPRSIL